MKKIKWMSLWFVVCFLSAVSVVIYHYVKQYRTYYSPMLEDQFVNHSVVLGVRRIPYPYNAMIAISPDADHQTVRKFVLLHTFLNTNEDTPLGWGLKLDIADSFFPYNGSDEPMPVDVNNKPIEDEMSYFKGTSFVVKDGPLIDKWIKNGWIDTLHSYGDFSRFSVKGTKFSRSLAIHAINTLQTKKENLIVWTNHGNQSNVDDFGMYGVTKFFDYQQGANPDSPYYHTDLTIPYGIKYVWLDRANAQFARKTMIYPVKLPDGQKIWGFWRYTSLPAPLWHYNVNWDWTVGDIAEQLSQKNLDFLIRNHDYAIVAQHLSANNSVNVLPPNAVDALRNLAKMQEQDKIMVVRTSRLLVYNTTEQFMDYKVLKQDKETVINIMTVNDPVFGRHIPEIDELRGITFYTLKPFATELEIAGKPIPSAIVKRNATDGIAPSIQLAWYTT